MSAVWKDTKNLRGEFSVNGVVCCRRTLQSIVSNRDTAYAQRGLIDQAAVDTLCESTLEQLYRMCKNERQTREALQLCIYQKNKLMETIQGRTK